MVTPKNNNRPANRWVINWDGAFAHRARNPEKRTSGYFGYKIICADGAGHIRPSSEIQEKSMDALKRSLFQSPTGTF